MPILDGKRVSLDEWRAAQAKAAEPVVEAVEAVEEEAPKPATRRRGPSKAAQAAQVMAAMGLAPEVEPEPEPVVAAEEPAEPVAEEPEPEAATEAEADAVEETE